MKEKEPPVKKSVQKQPVKKNPPQVKLTVETVEQETEEVMGQKT